MNCSRFQQCLHEYLEGTLSPAKKASVGRHLAQCCACRELVRKQQQIEQFLSIKLRESAQTVALNPDLNRRVVTALHAEPSPAPNRWYSIRFWTRFALPLTAAAACLIIAALLVRFLFLERTSRLQAARPPEQDTPSSLVFFEVSYCVPIYNFRKEGNFITDVITCDPRVVTGALLAKN